MEVIFKVKTIDKQTREEFAASIEPVEVSDAFAARLLAADPKGENFEVVDHDYESEMPADLKVVAGGAELTDLQKQYEEITGEKAGNKGEKRMKKEIAEKQMENLRAEYKTVLGVDADEALTAEEIQAAIDAADDKNKV